jgi:hypothetical protein
MANNIITLTKGDTFDFNVAIFEELYGHYYTGARAGDKIVFKLLKPNQEFFSENAIIEKEIILKDNNPNDECIFYLEHDDTVNLPTGVYYYAVKLIRDPQEGENFPRQVLTLINKTKFVLNS